MAIGDSVRVGFGSAIHGVSGDTVPVYELESDAQGHVRFDINGCAFPRPVGGVKGGSIAKIAGEPVRVQRSYVEKMSSSVKGHGGLDYVMLFPVLFEYYQKTAFVHQDHVHLVYGQLT